MKLVYYRYTVTFIYYEKYSNGTFIKFFTVFWCLKSLALILKESIEAHLESGGHNSATDNKISDIFIRQQGI